MRTRLFISLFISVANLPSFAVDNLFHCSNKKTYSRKGAAFFGVASVCIHSRQLIMSSSSLRINHPETPLPTQDSNPSSLFANVMEGKPEFAIIANRKSISSISSKSNLDELSTKVDVGKSQLSIDDLEQEVPEKPQTTEETEEKTDNDGIEEPSIVANEFKITHPKLKTKIPRTEILKILYEDQHSDETPEVIASPAAENLVAPPSAPNRSNKSPLNDQQESTHEFPKVENLRFLSVSSSDRTTPRATQVDLTHYTADTINRTSISQEDDRSRMETGKSRPSIDRASLQIRSMIDKFKKKMLPLKTANLSIVIDSYDFLFSDFDPRMYNERLLSTDFLEELRRRVQRISNSTQFQLRILVPMNRKDDAVEVLISERIQKYFQYKFKKKRLEVIKFRIYAATWIVLGLLAILLATIANITLRDKIGEYYSIIDNIINPASWFIIWSGLDLFFIKSHGEDFLKDLNFFSKMKNIQITFQGFEYENSGIEEMDE